MEEKPLVSFIIVNYNTFDLTSKAISSIIEHSKLIDVEIVLVDNASAEKDPQEFKKAFPEIVLIESDKNLGFAGGNNLGIENSKGAYICLMNSDAAIIEADWYKLIEVANDQGIGFVTGRLVFPDGRLQYNCQPFPWRRLEYLERAGLHKLLPNKLKSRFFQGFYFDYENVGYPDWIWGTFMFFNRNLLSIYNDDMLPNDFFMYYEDLQWCLLAGRKGLKCIYLPTIKIRHEFSKSDGRKHKEVMGDPRKFKTKLLRAEKQQSF
jgi:GT2 family glycosyltransferase